MKQGRSECYQASDTMLIACDRILRNIPHCRSIRELSQCPWKYYYHQCKANKTYLLKKEHFAQLTSTVLHAWPSIWGEDADSFNFRRFLHIVNGARAGVSIEGNLIDLATPFRDSNGKSHSGPFLTVGRYAPYVLEVLCSDKRLKRCSALYRRHWNGEWMKRNVSPLFRKMRAFKLLSVNKLQGDV